MILQYCSKMQLPSPAALSIAVIYLIQGWRSRDKSRSRDLNFKVSVSRLGEKFGSRSRSNWISVSKQKLRLETSVIGTAL